MTVLKLSGRCQFLALAVFVPLVPVAAQTIGAPAPSASNPGGAVVQPLPPIDPLAANLKILAQNPYDVNALTEAGIGALEVGDPQAAIGFLARAEELSPRDPRIKASLGSALTMVERPQEAMVSFSSALSLGYPERLILRERGLAYDLLGDHKKAQKDYAAVEKQANDPEAIRRHALSLGIVGDMEQALKLIDPLVRRGDQGAWRSRAFILAMNGEMPQADRIIRAATPPAALNGMMAFLRRLPSLTSAQRASAVNFGTIPTTGPIYAAADPAEGFRSVGNGQSDGLLAAAEAPRVPPATATAPAQKLSRADLRQAEKRERELAKLAARGQQAQGIATVAAAPGASAPTAPQPSAPSITPPPEPVRTAAISERVGKRIGPVDPERLPPELRGAGTSDGGSPVRPVPLPGVNALPPPDGVQPAQAALVAVPGSPPVQTALAVPPALPKPDPAPVVSPPVAQQSTMGVIPAAASSVVVTSPDPKPAAPAPAQPPQVAGPPVAFANPPATRAASGAASLPSTSLPGVEPIMASVSEAQRGFGDAASSNSPTVVETIAPPNRVVVEGMATPPEPIKPAPLAKPENRLGSILAGIEPEAESAAAPLPSEAQLRAQRLAAQRKAEAEAKIKADKEAEKAAAAKKAEEEAAKAKANPARIWVQIATGSNRAGLPQTFRKVREEAPKAMDGKSGWFVPFKATYRLLVGPAKSAGDARTLVTALSKEGVAATTWSSEAGQEVLRLGGR